MQNKEKLCAVCKSFAIALLVIVAIFSAIAHLYVLKNISSVVYGSSVYDRNQTISNTFTPITNITLASFT